MMRVRPTYLAHALALVLSVADAQTIPEAHCTSLAGTTVNLPADLRGRTAILVLGFSRDSQESVTPSGAAASPPTSPTSPTVSFYELAMLESVPRIMRGLVVRSMKKDVSERNQPHFLPVTGNEAGLAHHPLATTSQKTPTSYWSRRTAPYSGRPPVRPRDAAYAELKKHLR